MQNSTRLFFLLRKWWPPQCTYAQPDCPSEAATKILTRPPYPVFSADAQNLSDVLLWTKAIWNTSKEALSVVVLSIFRTPPALYLAVRPAFSDGKLKRFSVLWLKAARLLLQNVSFDCRTWLVCWSAAPRVGLSVCVVAWPCELNYRGVRTRQYFAQPPCRRFSVPVCVWALCEVALGLWSDYLNEAQRRFLFSEQN